MNDPETKTLYIHIGTFKTASSYFQNTCYLNRKRLQKAGVIYPKIGASDKDHIGRAHRLLFGDDGWEKLFTSMHKAKTDKFLISWEGFSQPKFMKMMTNSKALNRSQNQNINMKVIFVVRSYVDFMRSLYRQFSKSRKIPDHFETFLQDPQQPHNWVKTVKYWADNVGAENIIIMNYDTIKADVAGNIIAATDVDVKLQHRKNIPTNPSQSAVSAKVCRMLNEVWVPRKHVVEAAVIMRQFDEKNPNWHNLLELTDSDINLIQNKFTAGMEVIKGLMKIDFDTDELLQYKSGRIGDEAALDAGVETLIKSLLDIDHEHINRIREQLETIATQAT